jgi:hypothetical protein
MTVCARTCSLFYWAPPCTSVDAAEHDYAFQELTDTNELKMLL